MDIVRYLILLLSILFVLPANVMAAPFIFATLGDTQDISDKGQARLNGLIESINQRQPAFVVHIGELKGGGDACSDAYYQRLLRTANQFNNPFVYLPGDNDWTDCVHSGFDPLERLRYLRDLLYPMPMSLGKMVMPLTRQSVQSEFRNFPENVWWQQGEVLFASFHNVGTNNHLHTHSRAIQEYLSRNTANLAWLNQIFERASSAKAKALVLFTHANIKFDALSWESTGFDNFRVALSDHLRKFSRPVLLVHGDTHKHKIDKPLKYKHKTIAHFTRLEVFGSPDLGVIYVHVHPETDHVFRFEPVAINLSN